jgi:acetyl-CoA carboxylase biotin carboxyl carrier protein
VLMDVRAPMSGNVWKIEVSEKQQVKSGDVLIILESMKMEIPIEADKDGTIVSILVSEGDFVQEDDLLLILE